MDNILVSISVITYNQEEYINQTLDGIIFQQTTFPIEIIIGDDCSTDKTRSICITYKERYPDIIKLRLPETNMGSMPNWIANIEACRGKYIAICEGDDYWTDPMKLQKQVDFMENNPSFSMCAHASNILTGDKIEEAKLEKSVYTTKDLLDESWGIMTASILFRKESLIIEEWYRRIKNGDYGLQLLLSLKGNIGYLPDNMSVYRRHAGGISTKLLPFTQAAWMIYLLYEFNKYTDNKYLKDIKNKIKAIYKIQIEFAKTYNYRKASVKLTFFQTISPILPFVIKKFRK